MIPAGAFTASPNIGAYIAPYSDDYNPLSMRASGGTAVNDGSAGREVQNFTVTYSSGTISVAPSTGGPAQFTLSVAGVLAVSLAFDNNMAVALGYMKSDGAYLYYFNSLTNAYDTLHYSDGTSCRVCVDDTKTFYNAASDVIFSYVSSDGHLYYRQQRDRYATRYTVGLATSTLTIIRLGLTVKNRLQFQLQQF